MRRIELRPDIVVPDERILTGTKTVSMAKWLSDFVYADGSFGLGRKAELGHAIISKLASARGHVFLENDEYAALMKAYSEIHTLTAVAIPAAGAGWQRALEVEAEEWVEKDEQLVRKE